MNSPYLFHFDLKLADNMKEMFCDVKFVCIGGSVKRIKDTASVFAAESSVDTEVTYLSGPKARYSLYKVKNVLLSDHGIGVPSMSIVLHEIAKLLKFAGCKGVAFIRLGTCGGIGVEPGSIVITNRALDTQFRPVHEISVLGKVIQRSAEIDQNLVNELQVLSESLNLGHKVVVGATICANDYYEEQGRLDGAICTFSEAEKMNYLKLAYEKGVRNFEMECVGLAAFCKMLGYQALIVCVALLDRLLDDLAVLTEKQHQKFEMLPSKLVCELLKDKGAL